MTSTSTPGSIVMAVISAKKWASGFGVCGAKLGSGPKHNGRHPGNSLAPLESGARAILALDDLRRRVEVDDALVDAHLEAVPCLGTLTARRLARCNAQYLCGEAHGTGHLALQSLLLSAALEVGAHCVGSGGMGVQTICQAQCSQVKWFFAFQN